MSILNVQLLPDRVLVAVDTHAAMRSLGLFARLRGAPAVSAGDVCKMSCLPCCGCVLAARGSPGMLQLVMSAKMLSFCRGFDALLDELPGLAAEAYRQISGMARKAGVGGADLEQQELAVAGYSDRERRMVCVVYAQESASHGFERWDIDDATPWVTPWWSEETEPGPLDTAGKMLATARRQVAEAWQRGHDAIGGRLILAEVRMCTVHIEEVGLLVPAAQAGRGGIHGEVCTKRTQPGQARCGRPASLGL